MRLLTKADILKYIDGSRLLIDDFDKGALNPTFYDFHLGTTYAVWSGVRGKFYRSTVIGQDEAIVIPPRGYVLVHSLEKFHLSESVMALLGPVSDLARNGLRLNNSPFIDPGFNGWLEFGLENVLDERHILLPGRTLGKVTFFDVGDAGVVEDYSGEDQRRFFHLAPLDWVDPIEGTVPSEY